MAAERRQPAMADAGAGAGNRGLDLPVVDLSSSDLAAAAESIRKLGLRGVRILLRDQPWSRGGVTGEGVRGEQEVFRAADGGEDDAAVEQQPHGYTPPHTERLDASCKFRELNENFSIGPIGSEGSDNDANQWPSEERFPCWKETMKLYYATGMATGKRILSLIALSLNLDVGFFDYSMAHLRLLHYPGEVDKSNAGSYGASAHSDYGTLTILVTDGTPGLQICREKDRCPRLWEDVCHIDGALVVNIGDLLERWTNCVFRSTLHRVVPVGKERYSVAFFVNPNPDAVVQCLDSCSRESCPPRFPPITASDYLKERLNTTYK